MALRRGLLKELRKVLPGTLGNEVLGILRGIAYTERVHRISLDSQNACIQGLVDKVNRIDAARVAALRESAQPTSPYAFELGERVEIASGNKAGECGTVEAIRRDYGCPRSITYGVAIENRGGLYYFPSSQLNSAP